MGIYMGERLEDILGSLSREEKIVLNYFIKNLSVGEILAVKELRLLHRLEDPIRVIDILIRKGLLEKGAGCISLSRRVRDIISKRDKL
jgi:hypothetical protein